MWSWIFHDCWVVCWDWNVHLVQLNCDWSQRVNHFGFICCESSCGVLQIYQSLLHDLIDFVFCDPTQVFRSWNCQDFSRFGTGLFFAQTHKCTCLCVDSFDCLPSFTDYKSDQSCGDFDLHTMRTSGGSTCHFTLRLNNCVQLFSHSFHCIWITLDKNISCLWSRSTTSCNLHFLSSRSLSNGFNCLPFFSNDQSHTLIGDLQNVRVLRRWPVRSCQWQIVITFTIACNTLLILNHLLLFHFTQSLLIRKNDSFNLCASLCNLGFIVTQNQNMKVLVIVNIICLSLGSFAPD